MEKYAKSTEEEFKYKLSAELQLLPATTKKDMGHLVPEAVTSHKMFKMDFYLSHPIL